MPLPAGHPADPPAGQAAAELSHRLDLVEHRAADLERVIVGDLELRVARLEKLRADLANTIEGPIASKLSALDFRAGTQAGKVVKDLNRKLGTVYNHAFPYGIVYPTVEAAAYGLATGDALGSMGLADPVPDTGGAGVPPVEPDSVGLPPPVADPTPPSPIPTRDLPPVQPGLPGVDPGVTPWFDPRCADGIPTTPFPPGLTCETLPAGTTWAFVGPICPTGWIRTATTDDGNAICMKQGGPVGGPVTPPTPPPSSPPAPAPTPTAPASAGCCCGCCTQAQPTCPPGYHYDPDGPAETTLHGGPRPPVDGPGESTLHGGGHLPMGVRSGELVPCEPAILSGWCQIQCPPPLPMDQGGTYHPPYIPAEGGGVPFGTEPIAVGGCHFRPPRPEPVLMWVYPGHRLYVRSSDGHLVAASNQVPGYADFVMLAQVLAGSNPAGGPAPAAPGAPAPGRCVPGPEQCKIPPKATCGPVFGGELPALTGDQDDVCRAIDAAIKKLEADTPEVRKWIGMLTGPGGLTSGAIPMALAAIGLPAGIVPNLVNRFADWLQLVIRKANEGINCKPVTLLPIIVNRAVFRFINYWTGAIPTQLLTQLDQISNTVCQANLPSVSEADRAFLADTIDHAVWECWVKAAGSHPKEAQAVRDAGREKLNTRQTIHAMMRRRIRDERFDELMRQNGVLHPRDRAELVTAEEYWPTHTDLISWLRKDVFDDEIVKRFDLDQDFEKKYTDRLKKLAEGAGLDDEQMRMFWRSHWRPVGTHRIFEAFHRLRPGVVGADLAVTREDVEVALKQEDVPPFWVPRLLELSYQRVTRVDVRRMYELHQIDERQLHERMLDLGYPPRDAAALVDYWQTDRRVKEAKKNGLPSGRGLVNGYARGEMTGAELMDVALKISYYPEQPQEIMDAAELARDMAVRKAAIGAVKQRYTRGLIGPADAAAQLAQAGVDPDAIEGLIRWWNQIIQARGKHASAAELCKWRRLYLITAGEHTQALIRLGYDAHDADLIARACELEMMQAQGKAAEKAAAAVQKAVNKQAQTEAAKMKAATKRGRASAPASPNGHAAGAAGP